MIQRRTEQAECVKLKKTTVAQNVTSVCRCKGKRSLHGDRNLRGSGKYTPVAVQIV